VAVAASPADHHLRFLIPGVFYWVMGDGFAVAAVVWRTGAATSFTVAFNFGSNSLVSALGATDGASCYGVNIFALICAVYLNRLLRAGYSSKTTADEPSRTGDAGAPLTLTRKAPALAQASRFHDKIAP
jgi:hypothetical protein